LPAGRYHNCYSILLLCYSETLQIKKIFPKQKIPLLLYINGQLADLDAGQVIAQTKQVNDLNSLDNRQAGYTNKFRLPKTAVNLKIMDFLTITGNNSAIPYQKNECSLYSATGECFVYKGWAVITDGGDSYEATVYDGIIDIYKAIENKTLADLNLDELNHTKTITNITNSWNEALNLPYRYILANYNGRTRVPLHPTWLNADYLIPSVNVKWLFKRLLDTYGFGFSGSIFDAEDFKNLWMTFPKGLTPADLSVTLFESGRSLFIPTATVNHNNEYRTMHADITVNGVNLTAPYLSLKVPETGTYRLTLEGNIKTAGTWGGDRKMAFYITKNSLNSLVIYKTIGYAASGEDFAMNTAFPLAQNETISILIKKDPSESGSGFSIYTGEEDSAISIKLIRVDGSDISFKDAFAGFSTRDFLNEVVYRFGLTLFRDRYAANYEFRTLAELFETANKTNWSSKFIKKVSEKYQFASYAQKNWMRYAYNNKESSYNDACLEVADVNLAETKDILKSKIYSPEPDTETFFAGISSRIYKLWDKEVTEDTDADSQTIEYKPLDSRYYFLRSQTKTLSTATLLYSTQANEGYTFSSAPFEGYEGLPFQDLLQKYYSPLEHITNQALIITADVWLTDADVAGFDFRRLYYIPQLSGNFLVNKINNYIPGQATRCELIRVSAKETPIAYAINITDVTVITAETFKKLMMAYETIYNPSNFIFQHSSNGLDWETVNPVHVISVTNPAQMYVTAYTPGPHYFRLLDTVNHVASNAQWVAL
jgi:hypothetical protein